MSEETKPTQLNNEMALAIVKDAIMPGQPTLGLWFGWNQPNEESTVKLGSICGRIQSYTVRELLHNSDLELWQVKDILREMKYCKLDKDETISERWALALCDEVFIPYGVLSPEEKALYRLKVLLVNTMTEGHNWAIEYGDYLATVYYRLESAGLSEWRSQDAKYSDLHDILADYKLLPVAAYEESDCVSPKYNPETYEFALGKVLDLFPDLEYNYQKSGVSEILAWVLDWLKDEYQKGNLVIDLEKAPRVI